MSYSLLGHTFAQSSGGGAVTTSDVDTSGANLITVVVSSGSLSLMTVTDSKSNGYTNKTLQTDGATVSNYNAYVQAPTVGTGHNFTVGNVATFPTIFVAWWSGSMSTPFDAESGADTGGLGSTTGAPGSITPAESNELFVIGATTNGMTPAFSIDSGFTITDSIGLSAGNAYGGAFAYKIVSDATEQNPTWTQAAANLLRRRMACVRAVVDGTPFFTVLGARYQQA